MSAPQPPRYRVRSLAQARADLVAALQGEPLLPEVAARIRRMIADIDAEMAQRQRAA